MKRRTDNDRGLGKKIYKKYEYSEIGTIEEENEASINFYAVVIDACFPYKVDEKKYMCYLKVVDDTCKVVEGEDNFAIIALQSRRFEDLPIIQRCGDIIRVHRAEYNLKDDQHYFKLNMSYSSSWALFSADDEVAPEVIREEGDDFTFKAYAFSGKQYNFEKQDHKLLKGMRLWNRDYFTKNEVIVPEMYTALCDATSEDGDFNILCRVTQIVHRDHYTSDVRVKDISKHTWFMTVSRRKFPRIHEGCIIKIRSVNIDGETERERCLDLAPHSNIMTFVPFSKLRKQLLNDISLKGDKVDKELYKKPILTEPVLATKVHGEYEDLHFSSLGEVYEDSTNKDSVFRTRFFVIKATPENTGDFVEDYTPKNSGRSRPVYKIQLLVKDPSTALNDNLYKVYLYSHNGLGVDFFPGIDPASAKGSTGQNKLQKHLDTLLKFNVHAEAILERVGGAFFIRDTTMKS